MSQTPPEPAGRPGRGFAVGAALLGAVALAALAGLVVDYDVVADVAPGRAGAGPSAAAWLGADHLGRNVGLRLLVATPAFVLPGLLAAAVAGALGGLAGLVAGWFGGSIALLARSVTTALAAVPRLVLVLLAAAILGSSSVVLALAAGAACAPGVADALRARIDALRRAEFVLALRAHGVSDARILFWHLLWVNGRGLLARELLATLGFYLVADASLSYLGGFGVQEPSPSWGNMLAFEFGIQGGNPLAWLAPAAAIWGAGLGIALLARAIGAREGAHDG